jgi:hypothetical protein
MGDLGPKGNWIAPEDVPDPIALRGRMIPREAAPNPGADRAERDRLARSLQERSPGIGAPTFDLGTLDPLDPLDPPASPLARAPAEPAAQDDAAALPGDETLEPTPPVAARVEPIADPPFQRFRLGGGRMPAAVWVGGTLLVVAVLSMGIRMLTAGAAEEAAPAVVPVTRPPPAQAAEPVPVDAAAPARVEQPLPSRPRPRKNTPPQASLKPTGESAPPAAVVRPLTPPAAASLEPEMLLPKNPWAEVDP